MGEILHDTHTWFALSFAVFVVIAFLFGRKLLTAKLDARIESIRADIQAAELLYAESSRLLAEYRQKHADAVRECGVIRAEAEKNAEALRANAEGDLNEMMERRERQLEERLSRMKQTAFAEIQQYAADLAAAAAAEIIARKLDKKTNDKLVDRAIENIGKNLH